MTEDRTLPDCPTCGEMPDRTAVRRFGPDAHTTYAKPCGHPVTVDFVNGRLRLEAAG